MSTKIFVRGDLTTQPFYVGEPYTMRYRPTTPAVRQQTPSGGQVAVTSGRLQLKTLTFNYSRTGAFHVQTQSPGRDPKDSGLNGLRPPVVGSHLGHVSIADGSFRVLSPGNAKDQTIEIKSSSFLPCWFTSIDWEGQYVNRAQHI